MFDPEVFTEDFELEPDPDEEPQSEGPWISHGTVHVGRKPNH